MSSEDERIFRTAHGAEKLFIEHEWCWWILGQKPARTEKTYLRQYRLYSLLVNVIFEIGYPIHLILGLFYLDSTEDVLRNLSISLSIILATFKSYTIWRKFDCIKEVEDIMRLLEERVYVEEDIKYLKKNVFVAARHVAHLFYFICVGCFITSEVSTILTVILNKWSLMYPAYFPFDPYSSTSNYVLAHLYQIIGLGIHIFQNFVSDTYGGMCMAYVSGHVRLLGERVGRIGYVDSKTFSENNVELIECIKDHKLLLRFRHKLEDVVSHCLLLQIILAAVNISIILLYLLYYVNDFYNFIFLLMVLIAMPMEIFPCCYYGSKLQIEFENLTIAIFRCNWIVQNKVFKKNLRIFAEQTIRPVVISAGGMVQVHFPIFISSCKMAYSMFMVILRMK